MVKNISKPLPNTDMLVIEASRESIEAGDIQPVLDILETLLEPENIKNYRDKLMFVVNGYDRDERELCEIKDVRMWLQMLDLRWNYWFYFVNPIEELTLKFLAFTLSEIHKAPNGKIYMEADQLKSFLISHFHAMNVLEEKGLITETENKMTSRKIENYFKRKIKL